MMRSLIPKKLLPTKRLGVALAAGALVTLGGNAATAADMPGEGVTVKPGVATWSSAIPVSWVVYELMGKLGYDMQKPTSLSNPVAFLALREGDIHYFPNGWFPLHNAQLPDNFKKHASVLDPLCKNCGYHGYLVDKKAVKKFDIKGIMDIVNNKKARKAFDHKGDDRIELYGCPAGWGCHEGIKKMINKFNLSDDINFVQAGYSANFAEAMSQIKGGGHALYLTWVPSAWVHKLKPGKDVMWINAPGIVETKNEKVSGIKGAVTDPIKLGFRVNHIQPAANKKFLKNNPAAAELLRQIDIPLSWISKMDAMKREKGLTDQQIRDRARQWIKNHPDKVNAWLEEARAAAKQ